MLEVHIFAILFVCGFTFSTGLIYCLFHGKINIQLPGGVKVESKTTNIPDKSKVISG
jgi:hypothetical protein